MGNKAGNRMRDRVSDIAEYGRHKSRRQFGRHKHGMEQQQGDNGQWGGNGKTMGNNLEANGREVGEKAGHKSKTRETMARKPGEN